VGNEGGGEARERLVTAVPDRKYDRVEQLVVTGSQASRALFVLPDPGGESVGECLLLLSANRVASGLKTLPPLPSES